MNTKTPASTKRLPAGAGWTVAALAAVAGAVSLVYYWRVFYDWDKQNINVLTVNIIACIAALALVGIVWLLSRSRDFALRGAACILLCGVLFAFANPPMQAPDEYDHYLRAYAVSQGHLDFDGSREYPQDVARLYRAFPGAWVSAHTSQGMMEDEQGNPSTYTTAGYALKRYGDDGEILSVMDGFEAYFSGEEAEPVTEPIVVMVLPFVPQALGMALARLFGLKALGCLYAGRLANLLCYTAVCWLALKNLRRAQPLFLAVMLLPLSLYMAASLSYDALLLACYYLMLSYLDKESFERKDLLIFLAAFGWVNIAKPAINLLWLILPLCISAQRWRVKLKKWQFALCGLALAGVVTAATTWYGNAFRHGYDLDAFARMTQGADQLAQLKFVLSNPLRFAAVLAGTLYENNFFLGQLGTFGALDLSIPILDATGALVLLAAAVLCIPPKQKGLEPMRCGGLGLFCVLYFVGAMAAMYITYTPVGMVRVIGLQARYFLPVFLGLFWLLAQGFGHWLEPKKSVNTLNIATALCGGYGLLGALLLYQHYFVGPIFTIK